MLCAKKYTQESRGKGLGLHSRGYDAPNLHVIKVLFAKEPTWKGVVGLHNGPRAGTICVEYMAWGSGARDVVLLPSLGLYA